jgi:hypothetical protein
MKCKKDLVTHRGFSVSNERSSIPSVPVDTKYCLDIKIEDDSSLITVCGDSLYFRCRTLIVNDTIITASVVLAIIVALHAVFDGATIRLSFHGEWVVLINTVVLFCFILILLDVRLFNRRNRTVCVPVSLERGRHQEQ